MTDTIVAVATAHGIGSISIVRLSGKDALSLAKKLIKNKDLAPRYATFSKIYSKDGDFIDEGIVIYFKSPFSFTGEDIVEFQTHGGFVISNLITEELIKLGARIAQPGEFSKRAFLNDKMDLAKAESIQALITSRSEDGARVLARLMHGELSEYVNSLRDELVKTLAYVETCIDYADDDLPSGILEQTKAMLEENYQKLSSIVEVSEQRKGLIEGFKIAIIGKPNVGKSSILNALLHYDRAIISDEAGTTRDRIEESLQVGTHLVRIIDTAGIRDGVSNIEKIGIENSIKATKEADIILAVFDNSRVVDDEDRKILEICKNSDKKIIYVLNKCDLPAKFELNLDNSLQISAKNSSNLILCELKTYLDTKNYDGIMLSSNRQIQACKNAKEAILRANNLLEESLLEFFAYELNLAITEISSITKPYERSEILDAMFSHFCLGK
ncbi:tRNA uridine-5-carboxymethylaminomethyl(34) synthesis GTPase MnmE [Campylobacter geochelonis]|uniref:tRNA uridine-5-carboxymethylaminomethyl(34) synthesis GTPase MnmE n=1 Tax=Campylobacter geochelonis TaxID=1780362 RepID=UPI000770AFB9|nr:tRNA uridine-5-carboxymethylaminomethyl(34) synthesis GTPase MnmE [Campylobacter geochelonis]CZE48772.1 tRNA modification GTPase TrmE [Campylobacter geochelonis]CZE51349.1 tRNA modification GTPase TrmE [Campylobacter geochelonis]